MDNSSSMSWDNNGNQLCRGNLVIDKADTKVTDSAELSAEPATDGPITDGLV